jgi:hypothetical protein
MSFGITFFNATATVVVATLGFAIVAKTPSTLLGVALRMLEDESGMRDQ